MYILCRESQRYRCWYPGKPISGITVAADDDDATYPWTDKKPADFQSNVSVANGKITGTLDFIEGGLAESGPLAGDGNFLALKFSATNWSNYTSVKVGLEPSYGTGLVEIINDPDKNAVFKITDHETQKFKVVCRNATTSKTQAFSLYDLVCLTDEA